MHLALSPEDVAFQEEVRRFLDAELTPELREESARQAGVFADGPVAKRWHDILYRRGWIAPAWPKEYGGTGWSLMQRYIFEQACAEAGAPVLPGMSLKMCGPVLMRYGTQAQKDYFLPRILSGEHYWCQGYSEPQAGSDLASLHCRAVRNGDDYVVDGSKIWTTHAQFANWIFLLVRTSQEGKPQAGISFLLAPMDLPGISVRPIISISGDHEVNQVFFDSVRVPAENLVGEENQGWAVAKYLLEFERSSLYSTRIGGLLSRIRAMAAQEPSGYGEAVSRDPDYRRRLAELEIETLGLDYTERRLIAGLSAGQNVGPVASSSLKLRGSETLQKATELAVDVIAHYAQPVQARRNANEAVGPEYAATPTARYLNARASSIFGGSSEVQRNILARIALQL